MKFYPKCPICGTPGHYERTCPVRDLNNRQEARMRTQTEFKALGLTPQLEREIEAIRTAWKDNLKTWVGA